MKKQIKITTLVLLIATLTITGCSGSADSLVEIKVLPKPRLYVGKDAKEVEQAAMAATNTRVAIENKVATTAEDVATIMNNSFSPK